MTAHPRYPRPSIIEALCEIYFQLPEGHAWSAAMTGRLFLRIQDEFPEMEPDQVIGVDVTIGPDGHEQRTLRPRLRTRFRHKDRPLLFQLSENILTVNTLAPYTGWQQMRSDILSVWQNLVTELRPASITRIGLRYINRFPLQHADEQAEAWLRPSRYIAEGMLVAQPGSASRIEAVLSDEERIIVTVGYQRSTELPHGAVVFDIDRVTTQTLAAADEILIATADRLHEEVWQAFAEAKSAGLERYLNGEA